MLLLTGRNTKANSKLIESKGQNNTEGVLFHQKSPRACVRKFRRETQLENCDMVAIKGRNLIPRQILLATSGKAAGLDIYIAVRK